MKQRWWMILTRTKNHKIGIVSTPSYEWETFLQKCWLIFCGIAVGLLLAGILMGYTQ